MMTKIWRGATQFSFLFLNFEKFFFYKKDCVPDLYKLHGHPRLLLPPPLSQPVIGHLEMG